MANPNSSAAPIEQLLVMHCLKEDSVLGREGFSVRATSPGAADPATLDWALRLESYELPLDMKSGLLLANQAPRRLALVPGPPGRIALVHTAYLPEDTVGRSHSFISQILLLPELGAIPAVTTWGSSDWLTEEYPRGETKTLSPLEHLPGDSLIDEAALTGFLSGGAATADQSLARSIYPVRVESSPETRRRWIRAALHGFLRTGEPSATLKRVCILAEPGAVALLVYAIARLLPPQVAGTFSFSTYEPPHTSLRENKVARVIGSYARNGLDRADSDALRRRGYVVDTVRDAYGPDLMVEPSWPLEGLLKLVADGDWTAVDEVRALWSRDPKVASGATPASLGEAIRIRPLATALKAGKLDMEGLLELSRNRFGEGLIRDPELHRCVWEVVRKVWTQPGVKDKFADLLREHLDDLLAEVRDKAQSGPANAWREGWETLKPLVLADRRAGKLATVLEAIGASAGVAALSTEDRVALLREWSQSAPPNTALPSRLQWLLRAPDLPGFRGLARSSGVEPQLIGLAACFALSGAAGWEPGPGVLKDLTDEQFHALVEALATFPDREAVFAKLQSNGELIKLLVEWLIRTPSKISPERVEDLLWKARCDKSLGHEFWLADKHLESLLDRLATDSQVSRKLWTRLIERIVPENFDEGLMSAEIETLAAARERFPGSLADEDRKRLDGWNTLRIHFAQAPKAPTPGTAAKLKAACDAVGQDRDTLVKQWFDKWVLRAPDDLERKRRNESLGRALLGFYESENAACAAALKLADDAKDSVLRGECKTDLFNSIVSEENRDRLARWHEDDLRGTSIHPRLQSRDSMGSKGRGKKGLGVGKLRLPPEATRYVGAFVGGGVFTASLLLLLMPLIVAAFEKVSIENHTRALHELEVQLGRSKQSLAESEKQLGKSKTEIDKLKKELFNSGATINDLEGKLTQSETEINTLKGKLGQPNTAPSAPAQNGQQTGQQPLSATPIGSSENNIKRLRELVLDKPLEVPKFLEALKVATDLEISQSSSTDALFVSSVKRLLTGLSAYDVTADGLSNAADTKDQEDKSDFFFLKSGQEARSLLATHKNAGSTNMLSFYFLDANEKKTKRVRTKDSAVLAATSLGNFFLWGKGVGTATGGLYEEIYCSKSIDFYQKFKQISGNQPASIEGRALAFSIDRRGTKMALSDDGKRFAYAEPASGRADSAPKVEVRATESSGGQSPNLIDFNPTELKLDSGYTVDQIAFGPKAETLVVGFKGKNFLLAFGPISDSHGPEFFIKEAKPKPRKIDYNKPIQGWAVSSDNKLAVVTHLQVHVDDLGPLLNEPSRSPTDLVHGREQSNLKCVAFSPHGGVVATGSAGKAISIRLLGEPNQGREIMRLAHTGPVVKVGFSPDGRILAALALKEEGNGQERQGIIRLWVTKNWDPDRSK